ncbi:MAG: lipoprotein, partial [Bacteroidales bacterium]|nr:lipoprotein [Bacteroidales bacterium]
MKKILFLISTIFLLTACSSDDDVLSEKDAQLELDQIEQQVKLKSAADKQHRVAAYEAKQEKFVITLSDDTEVMLPNTSSFFTIGE